MIWLQWYMFVFVYFPLFVFIFTIMIAISLGISIRRNYTFLYDSTIYEKFASVIKLLVMCFIPLNNLYVLFQCLDSVSWEERTIKLMLEKGKIKRKGE